MAIIIEEDQCIGCGACLKACPIGAISMLENTHIASVDESLCSECGACITVCPNNAIAFAVTEIVSGIGSGEREANQFSSRRRGLSAMGRGGKGRGIGVGGECICTGCGTVLPHERGVPCSSVTCPRCNALMTRG